MNLRAIAGFMEEHLNSRYLTTIEYCSFFPKNSFIDDPLYEINAPEIIKFHSICRSNRRFLSPMTCSLMDCMIVIIWKVLNAFQKVSNLNVIVNENSSWSYIFRLGRIVKFGHN